MSITKYNAFTFCAVIGLVPLIDVTTMRNYLFAVFDNHCRQQRLQRQNITNLSFVSELQSATLK